MSEHEKNNLKPKEQIKPSSLVIYTTNLPASLEFYRALGINFQQEQHGKGPIHYAAQFGNFLFEIYPGEQPPRIGFTVESVDQSVENLGKQSIIPTTTPKNSTYGKFSTFKDPNNNTIEIREQPQVN